MKKIIISSFLLCFATISIGQVTSMVRENKNTNTPNPKKDQRIPAKQLKEEVVINQDQFLNFLQEHISPNITSLQAIDQAITDLKQDEKILKERKAQIRLLEKANEVFIIQSGTPVKVSVIPQIASEVAIQDFLNNNYSNNAYNITIAVLEGFLNLAPIQGQVDIDNEIVALQTQLNRMEMEEEITVMINFLEESKQVFNTDDNKEVIVKNSAIRSNKIKMFVEANTLTNNYDISKEDLEAFKTELERLEDNEKLITEFNKVFIEKDGKILVKKNENKSEIIMLFLEYQLTQNYITDPVFIEFYKEKVYTLKKRIKELDDKTDEPLEENYKEYASLDNVRLTRVQNQNLLKVYDSLRIVSIEEKNPQFLFPTVLPSSGRSTAFSRVFNKDINRNLYYANNANIQINNNGALVQSELVSAFLGPVKVAFGTLISSTNDDEDNASDTAMTIMTDGSMGMDTVGDTASGDKMMQESNVAPTNETSAFQRLLNSGGGNTYLNVELPLMFYSSKQFFFYLSAIGRLGLEIAEFSDDVDTTTGNANFFSNLYTSVSTDNNEFNFFANVSFGLYGGGETYYDRLGIEDQDVFTFGEITAGVTIQRALRFALTFQTFGSESNLRSGQIAVSAQILSF